MVDVDTFTDEQKKLLAMIVSDFGGPTATPTLLYMMENMLYGLKSDWELDNFSHDPDLKSDIEVCMAALAYLKVHNITNK